MKFGWDMVVLDTLEDQMEVCMRQLGLFGIQTWI